MSIHTQHGPDAIPVLQYGMKSEITGCLGELRIRGYAVIDNGNHYILIKGNKKQRIPLFAAGNVFEALIRFS